MSALDQAATALLRRLDPERAHGLALAAMRAGLGPKGGPVALPVQVAGMEFPNPVGLAAGLDKNATATDALLMCGAGFVEIGAVTPRPQPGNPKPRLFRLSEDRAVINRFGFNNDGMEVVAERLAALKRPGSARLGINLGANKDSADKAADYAAVLQRCGAHVDFATINVSSPNTEKLRDLQGKEALAGLLSTVTSANSRNLPLFLKIAPDLSEAELADIAALAGAHGLSGIVATNTTLRRDGLKSEHSGEAGGLSGAPLFDLSTRVLARLSTLTDLPLIGVGGIASQEDALEKIRAGASLVQLYTGLVYGGIGLAGEIAAGLATELDFDGVSLAECVGSGRDRWL